MPGTMTENENLLSLLSIEVLISQVEIDMNIPCHLPCMVFRLLDYPAVSIPFFDQWQIEEFHELKRIHPNVSWRQLLADQFYELRSANGKFNFKRGKSCLFKTYFKNLYNHLLNVPLFLLLIDQINNSSTNVNTTQFIGSCNVKLNELIEVLNQSIIRNGTDIPLVEQETFHCTLFNLMGTKIGTCDVAVRFCHYGTTILTHLPMLDDGIVKNMNDKSSEPTTKEKLAEVSKQTTTTITSDTVVKHIHFVNEKKDVGLQISRSDLPSTSNTNKSAQTRWTSTKTHPLGHHHQFKGRYPRTIEDSIYDDTSIASYQPPALYFNSNSDFLQMMTPANAKTIEEAKEDRLSYLASIPIASFQDEIDFEDPDDEEDDENQQPPKQLKSKVKQNVRFQLTKPSTPLKTSSQIKISPKKQQQQMLAKDFLHNFPLLRALVEEALALQDHEYDVPLPIRRIMLNERPHSAGQIKQRPTKSSPTRPKSAANIRSAQPKSVIVSRNINNTNRLYPSSVDRRQMIVTKHEVRNLVDRLSKPKFNKRLDREIADAEQITTADESVPTPRLLPKPTPAPPTVLVKKPPLSYGTTRAHRLYAEFARARRAAHESPPPASTKSPRSPRKEPPTNIRLPPSSPQLLNTGTLSHFSLLNKVDIDTATIDKNSLQPNTSSNVKTSSTTSQDVSFELNRQTSSSSSSSPTPEPTLPDHIEQNPEQNELGFSITNVTDYFTDGDNNSSNHFSPQQST